MGIYALQQHKTSATSSEPDQHIADDRDKLYLH
jgi:hypothetical protein